VAVRLGGDECTCREPGRAVGPPTAVVTAAADTGGAGPPDAACACERWAVVHWIDSKATFGDPEGHAEAMAGQFAGYAHRFGPGLVVYWGDYVAGIQGDGLGGSGGGGMAGGDVAVVASLPWLWMLPGGALRRVVD
jgi:hypothetical protein